MDRKSTISVETEVEVAHTAVDRRVSAVGVFCRYCTYIHTRERGGRAGVGVRERGSVGAWETTRAGWCRQEEPRVPTFLCVQGSRWYCVVS